MIELPLQFPHLPPEGYSYFVEQFNTRLQRIMLLCHREFSYNQGKPTATVWGFYNPKKKTYYSPVNSRTVGSQVNIEDTRNYTAMPLKLTGVEKYFV
jgi:hypothetical protein